MNEKANKAGKMKFLKRYYRNYFWIHNQLNLHFSQISESPLKFSFIYEKASETFSQKCRLIPQSHDQSPPEVTMNLR